MAFSNNALCSMACKDEISELDSLGLVMIGGRFQSLAIRHAGYHTDRGSWTPQDGLSGSTGDNPRSG